ncbi:MAG TPA: Maf family protein [Bdellovibrionales bacterium]|nr:Maf family protein [Bdellovibrionales bacterium]
MRRLILASQSPRRRELLERAGFEFQTFPVEISEKLKQNLSLDDALMDLARRKAGHLIDSGRLSKIPDFLVLASDTEVIFDNKTLGKPATIEENVSFLRLLSGQTHDVKTAVCLWDGPSRKAVTGLCTTRISFENLSENQINAYVTSKRPLDKAGGYGVQELPPGFVRAIDGPLDNVIGLPVQLVERMLSENGWQVQRRRG